MRLLADRRRNHPTATVPKPLADLLYRALRLTADHRGERVPVYVSEALELYERELRRRA